MSERSAIELLELAACLVSDVYLLIPRPTEPPPERQVPPPEHRVESELWYLIDALGPLAAHDHSEVWTLADTSVVFSHGEAGLKRILHRWNENFHRRRHALPGDKGYEE